MMSETVDGPDTLPSVLADDTHASAQLLVSFAAIIDLPPAIFTS